MDERLFKLQNGLKYVLKLFHEYCEKQNLKYYLAYGSLLGAIRHHDIIPWDDDMDIYMFRDEYNKLRDLWKKESPKELYLQSFDDVRDVYFTYAKIRLNGTTYNENTTKNRNMHKGIFIDLFILDYLPNNLNERAVLYKKMNRINKMTYYKGTYETTKKIKFIFTKLYSYSYLRKKRDLYISKIKDRAYVGYIGSFSNFLRNVFKVEAFKECMLFDFGKYQFYIPNGYEEILKKLYDNYMELPPVEKRINPHVVDIDFGNYDKLFESNK